VTGNIFGGKSYKLKPCNHCGQMKLYSDFYVKPNRQDVLPSQITSRDLRQYCVECFDMKNKTYNKGSRPFPEVGNTLDAFLE